MKLKQNIFFLPYLFILGFDVTTGQVLWNSYTLRQSQSIASNLQWRLDPRLDANQRSLCDQFPSGIESSSSLIPYFPFGKDYFILLILLIYFYMPIPDLKFV